jgi:hypothetical protein
VEVQQYSQKHSALKAFRKIVKICSSSVRKAFYIETLNYSKFNFQKAHTMTAHPLVNKNTQDATCLDEEEKA